MNKLSNLNNKNILIGISGSVAARKVLELVTLLCDLGAVVKIVATPNAIKFLSGAIYEKIGKENIFSEIFSGNIDEMRHIDLAKWSDCFLIAPASASLISRCAIGLADQLVSLVFLASTAPIFIAPAMNQAMWKKPAVQRASSLLKADGVQFIGPVFGEQACGDVGYGRMSEPENIVNELKDYFSMHAKGLKVLITAGPTQEAIDPVRYLSNRSSGKMGYAIAQKFQLMGAEVTLITGPTVIALPHIDKIHHVVSAKEMHDRVLENIHSADVFVCSAAVADYSPMIVAPEKIKKSGVYDSIKLKKNSDIISSVRKASDKIYIVGFALETENLFNNAHEKLMSKKMDLIVANQFSENNAVFGSDYNQAYFITKSGNKFLSNLTKCELARELVKFVCQNNDISL